MECDTVRPLLGLEPRDAAVIAHLAACPACRAEAELDRRLAAAVASMPRVPAPHGLMAAVMADIRQSSRTPRSAGPRPLLRLRSWELGWLSAACLLLVALMKTVFSAWVTHVTAPLSPWLSGWTAPLASAAGALSTLRSWALQQSSSLGSSRVLAASWTGPSFAWTCGAIGFALGLFLLLSWQGGGSKPPWEDAHG